MIFNLEGEKAREEKDASRDDCKVKEEPEEERKAGGGAKAAIVEAERGSAIAMEVMQA